jgi:hypothetical protein
MAVPASRFRLNGPARDVAVPQSTAQDEQLALPRQGIVARRRCRSRAAPPSSSRRVSPGGDLINVAGRQHLTLR